MHSRDICSRDVRLPRVMRGREVQLTVDGQSVGAFEGETVAVALLAAGKHALRHSSRFAEPRGLFCGIGVCFDCVMTINGRPNTRACQTPVRDGMHINTQQGDGTWMSASPDGSLGTSEEGGHRAATGAD